MKPQPKKEIVITSGSVLRSLGVFTILTASSDAAAWVQDNLTEFGLLALEMPGRFLLTFSPKMYDPDEMVAYIESMGVDDGA